METTLKTPVTKEVAQYCFRGIIQYLDGNTTKFNEYTEKAMQIYKKDDVKYQTVKSRYKVNGKYVQAMVNMKTGEVKDLQGNVLREGR